MPKILIIRYSSIGDLVVTSPIIRCVKKQLNAEVHFLVKENFRSIIENNPYIDKIWTRESIGVEESLLKEKFDYIIDLQKNLRSYQISKKLGVKTYRFNKMNPEKWLLVNLKWNKMPANTHLVDRYFEGLKDLNIVNDNNGLDYFIQPEDEIVVEGLPSKYIAFAIGSAHETKALPVEKIVSIIKQNSIPVVILGGKKEIEKGRSIEQEVNVINWVNKLSLNQSAAIVKNAEFVVAGDTGLMHIAAAFKKRIYSVWGSTVPAFGMFPYLPRELNLLSVIIENKKIKCRPCSKLGFEKCPKVHHKCMNSLDISSIKS